MFQADGNMIVFELQRPVSTMDRKRSEAQMVNVCNMDRIYVEKFVCIETGLIIV